MEEICAPGNMRAALKRVRANKGSPGSDGMSVEELPAYLRAHWPAIKDQLLQGTYPPQVVRRVAIPKLGSPEKRKLGIPCARDC
jgi:RNA-directed DNA polymerase